MAVNNQDQFLNIQLNFDTIDRYYIRTSIKKAIDDNLHNFNGIFLDLGCGEMPYREYIINNSNITKYIGVDIENKIYQKQIKPDIFWDGKKLPFDDNSIDTIMATEVFEHVPNLDEILKEIYRVLKPNGKLFFTVPFLWPLHDVPYDEYRYTPFSLDRHFKKAGFENIDIKPLGGWNASLAQMIGLWLKRSGLSENDRLRLSNELLPFYKELIETDKIPADFKKSPMITSFGGIVRKKVETVYFDNQIYSGADTIQNTNLRSKKKKILVIQGGFPSVSATFIVDQINGLIENGFEVLNWATYNTGTNVIQDNINKYNLLEKTTYIKAPSKKIFNDTENWVESFFELHNIKNFDEIDAIHVHYGSNFNTFEPLFRHFKKFILVSFHGYDASRYINTNGANCYNYLFERADLITTPSYQMQEKLISIGANKNKMRVHRYGINLDFFNFTSRQFSNNKIKFLTVGRFVEKKGIEYSLNAFAKICRNINSEYIIIGEGDLYQNYLDIINNLGISNYVKVLGAKDTISVRNVMAEVDIFVLTSVMASDGDSEGLPVSITEAQAMGLPVISTYHAGIPEIIQHGFNGLLSNEKDIDDIAKNMFELATNANKRKILSENAVKKIREEYNIVDLNKKLAGYFNQNIIIEQNNNINTNLQILNDRLKQKKWEHKYELYLKSFEYVKFFNKIEEPAISVVIITWRFHPDTLKNLQILNTQREENFELIFVNNGAKEDELKIFEPYIDTYVKLNHNTGAYLARNIGSIFANAEILLFLDDDGIPEINIIKAHKDQFKKYKIVSCRGAVFPKTKDNPYNAKAKHYYLGDQTKPMCAEIEGNTSYLSSAFFNIGGWDDEIEFGGGARELGIRFANQGIDLREQIYSPDPIIYHDFAVDENHRKKKRVRQEISLIRLKEKHPNWDDFRTIYIKHVSVQAPILKEQPKSSPAPPRILYIAFMDSSFVQVIEKMNYQIKGLEGAGCEIKAVILGKKLANFDSIEFHQNITFIDENQDNERIQICDSIIKEFKPDIIYIRYQGKNMVKPNFINWISQFNNVVYELQTKKDVELLAQNSLEHYQLEKENGPKLINNALGIVGISNDVTHYYTGKLKNKDNYLVLGNGLDIKPIKVRKFKRPNYNNIIMSAIGRFEPWHGFDRIIEGLNNYKENNITLYLVGYGKEYDNLKQLVKKYNLKNVYFTGWLDKEKQDLVLDNSEIVFNSLGLHRINFRESSTLKFKQYFAKGLPVVYSCPDVDIDENLPYIYKVAEDDSPLDMYKIIDFIKQVYSIDNLNLKIREYAEKYLDWSIKMLRLKDFFVKLLNNNDKIPNNSTQIVQKNSEKNIIPRVLFICHDFPPYRYAGAQLFAKNLAQAINRMGKAQVEILYPQFRDKNKQDYSITQTTYEDLTVFELNKPAAGEPGKVFNQNIAQSIYQFLSQNHYDLIHIHGLGQITMAPVFIAAKMQIKMIMTLHDFWFICTNWHLLTNNQDICTGPESIEKCALCFITDSPYHTKTEENYKKSIDFISERNLIFKEAYYKISKFYAPSNYLKNVFNKYGFFNIDVLNNGLTHKELSVNNRIRDDRNIIFGFTGQIIKRKGVIFLLEAFIAISNPNIELHIYGKIDVESDYGKNIQNMINSDNRIKYFGEYKNEKINEILSTLDIVVIPTLMDNYPITVQEAFYNKVPVIASNIGGIPEMVSHNKNGILTEPSSVSDLKNAMLKIIDHPELIDKFKENIPYIKSLEDNAREYLAEYNQILDNKIDLNKNSNNIILNEIKENRKIKILFYFFKNVHIPILEPIYRKLKAMHPEAQIAFGYMSYAPQIRAGFTLEEFELLKDFGEKLYNNPQDYNPDITFIADSCYEFVQNCGLLVHVGHGILSKGQYYTDTQLARREEYADLVCVPGEYHKKILNRIISKPVVATGMAKLDALYDGTYTREKIIQKYGLNPQNKFILYAPTFNDELSAIPFVYDRINEVIPDNNTFLLIKLHSSTKQEYKNMYRELFRKDARVIYIEDLNIAPYLALADIMISDVSSAMIEFASLDKPLILFNNPTWTTYKYYNPNDIEFKWRDIGIEVNNLEEMKQAVIRSLNTPKEFSHKRIYYTEQIIANKTYADASQKIINSALELLNKRVNIHSGVRI